MPGDNKGHEVDVHAFVCDERGNVVERVMYPPGSLSGKGVILAQQVKCIAPEHMAQFIAPWLYKVLRGGIAWRMLPKDFPPRSTVYHYFR